MRNWQAPASVSFYDATGALLQTATGTIGVAVPICQAAGYDGYTAFYGSSTVSAYTWQPQIIVPYMPGAYGSFSPEVTGNNVGNCNGVDNLTGADTSPGTPNAHRSYARISVSTDVTYP